MGKRVELSFNKVTTRGGDRGESSLYSGQRLRKDDIIFELLGDLDELSSTLGIVRAHTHSKDILKIQKKLLTLGACAATMPASPQYEQIVKITPDDVAALEKLEHKLLGKTAVSSQFICPGETVESAYIDVARTIARRCERRCVTIIRERSRPDLIASQQYLNRLSDYLFILARYSESHR